MEFSLQNEDATTTTMGNTAATSDGHFMGRYASGMEELYQQVCCCQRLPKTSMFVNRDEAGSELFEVVISETSAEYIHVLGYTTH